MRVPGNAGVGRPHHVGGLDVLLVVGVAWELLEQEIVQTLLSHLTLDRDHVGLRGLDQLQHGVGGEETLLQGRVDLQAGEVQVEGNTLL